MFMPAMSHLRVHLSDYRRRTSYRLVPEIDRSEGFETAQPVVVYDLAHFRVFHPIHGLAYLVVVHQYDLLAVYVEEPSS